MFRHTDLMNDTHYVDQLPGDTDVVIYQFSIGSPVGDRWAQHPALKVANYHNITPMSLVGKWDGLLAAEVQLGRDQMADTQNFVITPSATQTSIGQNLMLWAINPQKRSQCSSIPFDAIDQIGALAKLETQSARHPGAVCRSDCTQ